MASSFARESYNKYPGSPYGEHEGVKERRFFAGEREVIGKRYFSSQERVRSPPRVVSPTYAPRVASSAYVTGTSTTYAPRAGYVQPAPRGALTVRDLPAAPRGGLTLRDVLVEEERVEARMQLEEELLEIREVERAKLRSQVADEIEPQYLKALEKEKNQLLYERAKFITKREELYVGEVARIEAEHENETERIKDLEIDVRRANDMMALLKKLHKEELEDQRRALLIVSSNTRLVCCM